MTTADPGDVRGGPNASGDERPISARASVRRNAAALLVSQGFTWALALVVTTVQPRFLGPDGLGQLRLATSLWMIAGVLTVFGTNNLITVGLARRTDSTGLVQSAMALQILLYGFASVGVIVFSAVAGYRGQLLLVILITGCTPLVSTVYGVARAAVLFGLEQMSWPAKVDMITKAVSTGLLILLLVAGGRTVATAIFGVAMAILQSALMFVGLRRRTSTSLWPRWSGLQGVARRAMPFFLIEVTFTIYQQIDTVIISLLADETTVGWYGVADSLMGSLIVIPSLVLSALFPTLTRLTHDDAGRALRLVRQGMRVMLFFGVAVGVGMAIVAGQLAPLLFGDDFRPSAPVIAVRALAMVVMYPTILIGTYALATNRQNAFTTITGSAIIVSIPLNLLLVPWTQRQYGNGAIGGAMVYVISELLILTLATVRIASHVFDRSVVAAAARALLAGGAMVATTWWSRNGPLIITVLIGAATYVLVLVLTRAFNNDEREAIRKLGPRALRRLGRARGG